MPEFAAGYLGAVIVLSCVALVAYGFDKHRARHGGRRMPEKTLHLLALLGGWPGAIAGQQLFRHKTQKLSFRLVFWAVVILHISIVGGVVAFTHAAETAPGESPRSPAGVAADRLR